ncbi:hypothetical protein C4J93_2165 [Pseudomonas sp. R2-37-08W]|uniref:IpaD/SipD/SspD family type III secretion system needle tip protein n=1 Tax=unclassified Pseudomonas TaxID=196821 RepID=UPI000F5613D5|nr:MULTISPECIES: IpaD/SipD/SspD family type III secretion system needle tip protein [unclassified Pseudomonas]AZF10363.1 hypothetical protein C4J93_2165 [Pseudomonas sp. R2-37-08W]AZF20896.1 hypothetical protein C4J91_2146 [Pseudomonas sp. R3-52-08]MDQ0741104.1 type III secretion system IpaD/SipD/SspD family effector [Pseudomonas sp. W4I3]
MSDIAVFTGASTRSSNVYGASETDSVRADAVSAESTRGVESCRAENKSPELLRSVQLWSNSVEALQHKLRLVDINNDDGSRKLRELLEEAFVSKTSALLNLKKAMYSGAFDLGRLEAYIKPINSALQLSSIGSSDMGRSSEVEKTLEDKIVELIDQLDKEYQASYFFIVEQYAEFYSDFNEKITAEMSHWIEGIGESEVRIEFGAMKVALDAMIEKYSDQPTGVLYPPQEDGYVSVVSREEAEKWLSELGSGVIIENDDGGCIIMMDLTPLKKMIDMMPNHGSHMEPGDWFRFDSAKYSAWQTAFSSQEEELKNTLQQFTNKLDSAASLVRSFIQTLSSSISAIEQTNNQIMSNLK